MSTADRASSSETASTQGHAGRNVRLTVAYDGTAYVGWQVQPNGVSVQEVIEEAIRRLTGDAVRLIVAGRTDSGVHAVGQVCNFRTTSRIPAGKMIAGIQNFLPEDVIIRAADDVPIDFHATYSAKKKRYRYLIHNSRIADPFLRHHAWRMNRDLDVTAMQAAADHLLGTHDFRCFESQFPNKATSVRTILEAQVMRTHRWAVWETRPIGETEQREAPGSGAGEGEFICFDVVADGFLYNMVRAIVGTLVRIGRGAWPPEEMARIIAAQDRSRAGQTAPACGLYLIEVDYGG